jgi:hypothetical protein
MIVAGHLDALVALHALLTGEPLAATHVYGDAVSRPPELAHAPARARTESGPDIVGMLGVDQGDRRRPAFSRLLHGSLSSKDAIAREGGPLGKAPGSLNSRGRVNWRAE